MKRLPDTVSKQPSIMPTAKRIRYLALLLCSPLACSESPNPSTPVTPDAGLVDARPDPPESSPVDSGEACDVILDSGLTCLPTEVRAIVTDKCQRCHNTDDALTECLANGSCLKAPFPLVTFQDTRRPVGSRLMYERMGAMIESGAMPLQSESIAPPVEPLSQAEKQIMLDWVANCAPPGDDCAP